MMPNAMNRVLATQKMDDAIAQANRESIVRSLARRTRNGVFTAFRIGTGSILIAAGRRVQGKLADGGAPIPAGTHI
jgi:hypothetical protein